MSSEEIKQIYKVYGDLETIQHTLEKEDVVVDEKTAYSIFI
jgi:hypothetical protein